MSQLGSKGYSFSALSKAIGKPNLRYVTMLIAAAAAPPIPSLNSGGKGGSCVVVAAGGKF
jgi:hypothetical protein